MRWYSHILFSLFLIFLVSFFIPIKLEHYILAAFSSLLPDIDLAHSKIRRVLDICIILFSLFLFVIKGISMSSLTFSLSILGIYFVIITIFHFKHRGITHSLLFCLLYAIGLYFLFSLTYAIVGFLAYFSHLLGDLTIKII